MAVSEPLPVAIGDRVVIAMTPTIEIFTNVTAVCRRSAPWQPRWTRSKYRSNILKLICCKSPGVQLGSTKVVKSRQRDRPLSDAAAGSRDAFWKAVVNCRWMTGWGFPDEFLAVAYLERKARNQDMGEGIN